MASFTEQPGGADKSRITLRLHTSFLGTLFNGDKTVVTLGLFGKGPMMCP